MVRVLSVAVLCASLAMALPTTANGQATAANGNIEGIVRDTTGAALPGVAVTVTNMDTGTARTSVTNDEELSEIDFVGLLPIQRIGNRLGIVLEQDGAILIR